MSEEPKASVAEINEAEDYREDMGLSPPELSIRIGYSSKDGYRPNSNPMTKRTYLAVKGLYYEWLLKQKQSKPSSSPIVEPEYHLLVIQGSEVLLKSIEKGTVKVIDSLSSIFR